MSAPHPPPARPAAAPVGSGSGLGHIDVLALVAAGAGLIGYVTGFFSGSVASLMLSPSGLALIVAAALAGLRFAPGTPNCLFAAAPLAVYAVLSPLQMLVSEGDGSLIVLVVAALVQAGALVAALLLDGGVIKSGQSKPAPPAPPFAPPGKFQGPPGAWGGQQPPFGQPGGPPQGSWVPAAGGQQQPGGWGASSPGGNPVPPAGSPGAPGPQQGGPPPAGGSQPSGPQPSGPQPSGPQPSGPQPGGPQPGGPQSGGPQSGGPQSGGPQGTQHMPHPGSESN